MKADEARKISEAGKQLKHVYQDIKRRAEQGETSIRVHLTGEAVRIMLTSDGYHLKDEIDCDSDYRGTWISWGGRG